MHTVSVIIPSYGSNTDPCRAVDSVLTQDYPYIEVIVVDDNGAGSSQQISNEMDLNKYIDDPRFKYIVHEVNKGGSAARNTGVLASHGDYLCFLDDDDELSDKSKISLQMKATEHLTDDWAGTYSSYKIYKGDKFVRNITAKTSGKIVDKYIKGDIRIGTAAPIIKKTAFYAIGGFDESFKRHQDWEFFTRLTDVYKIMAVPEAFYNRYYKIDVEKRTGETRLEYMDKFVSSMKAQIKSIQPEKLNSLLKKRYVPIIFSLLKEGKKEKAKVIIKTQNFGIKEYLLMLKVAFLYFWKRVIYGTHF
jgi:glycosyltransferase involved in cell wall biosynthesis